MPRGPGFCASRRAPTASPPPVDWIDPPEAARPALYDTFVSAVDADGNEIAGIRAAADRGAARHLYRLERLSGAARRTGRPRRLAASRSPAPRPSARPPATRAPRSRSATAAATPMSRRSRRPPPRWSPSGCCCRPMPPRFVAAAEAVTGSRFCTQLDRRVPCRGVDRAAASSRWRRNRRHGHREGRMRHGRRAAARSRRLW